MLGQNAQISGLIQDPSALNVGGAQINVRNQQTGGKRTARSNESGFYSVYSLSPGTYRVSIQAAGFETVVREGVKLEVGDSARLDFSLRIGDSRSVVTIKDDPPLMNTNDASVGTVIGRNLIDRMPLNGRGIQTLIELTPGIIVLPVSDTSRGQFSVNGQRGDANYFTVDGVSANFAPGVYVPGGAVLNAVGQGGAGALPANNFLGTFSNLVSPDALQEFKIQTSTFAPEFGRSPGAQVGLVTRSGTNRYSGSLFEYFRNDVTDTNDWFANQLGHKKPPLRFNNFGGTLGGPLRLPHLYNGRDRSFFFLSLESLIARQPQPSVQAPVPTSETRMEAPALVAPLLNAFPLPNQPELFPGSSWGTFAVTSSLKHDQRTYGLRFDHYLNQKLIFFARYNRAPSERVQLSNGLQQSPANIEQYSIDTGMLTLGLTQIIGPGFLNEIRLNGSRQVLAVGTDIIALAGAKRPSDSLLFPAGYSAGNSNFNADLSFASFSIGQLLGYNAGQVQLADTLSATAGTHQLRFGIDFRRLSSATLTPLFSSDFIFIGLDGPEGVYSGVAYADVVKRTDGGTSYVIPAFSSFAQDTWRANRKVTVTYGLRWELNPPPRISKGQATTVNGLENLNDLTRVSIAPPGSALYSTGYFNFAPRVGLAWQLFDGLKGKTVMRMGAGIFYDLAQSGFQDFGYHLSSAASYLHQQFGAVPNGPPGSFSQRAASDIAVAAVPGYTLPRTYQWNITLEQAIGHQTFSGAYVGAAGRKLIGLTNLTTDSTGSSITVFGNNSSSDYHSLQLQYNRRLTTRAQVLLSYTWSHSMDNLSNDLASEFSGPTPFQFLHPNINRGSSDFDIRHGMNGAVVLMPPSPQTGIIRPLLRNWTVSSIFFARSAPPTDLAAITADSRVVRPDVVPGQPLYLYGSGYPGGKRYNPDAFQAAEAGAAQGNLGRNVLRGFGAWQIDFSLHREMKLSEHLTLQLRAEAFNILNHPNFANPAFADDPQHEITGIPYRSFGLSTATLANGLGASGIPGELNPLFQVGGARSIQFAVRIRF